MRKKKKEDLSTRFALELPTPDEDRNIAILKQAFKDIETNLMATPTPLKESFVESLKPVGQYLALVANSTGYDIESYTEILRTAIAEVKDAVNRKIETRNDSDPYQFPTHVMGLELDADSIANMLLTQLPAKQGKSGGKAFKKELGIFSAVVKLIQDEKRKAYSKQELWDYLEKHRKGKKKAIVIRQPEIMRVISLLKVEKGEKERLQKKASKASIYKVYFKEGRDVDNRKLFQEEASGSVEGIKIRTFFDYVKDARKL